MIYDIATDLIECVMEPSASRQDFDVGLGVRVMIYSIMTTPRWTLRDGFRASR
jgi:hypothetical protein